MRTFLVCLFSAMLVISMTGAAGAALINGDFQTGDLSGWTVGGDAADVRIGGPTFFSEAQGMNGSFALFGLEASAGTSSLSQTFGAPFSNLINVSFNWAFDFVDLSLLTSDSFVSVINDEGTVFDITMQNIGTGFFNAGITNGLFQDTFDITGFVGDDVTIAFSLNESSGLTFSLAGIDNVSVAPAFAPVPIPATLLLLGSGLICVVGLSKRKMKS